MCACRWGCVRVCRGLGGFGGGRVPFYRYVADGDAVMLSEKKIIPLTLFLKHKTSYLTSRFSLDPTMGGGFLEMTGVGFCLDTTRHAQRICACQ